MAILASIKVDRNNVAEFAKEAARRGRTLRWVVRHVQACAGARLAAKAAVIYRKELARERAASGDYTY